jgi:hypothetical protein
MYEQEIAQLRAMATSNDPDRLTRYRTIRKHRDHALTGAVAEMAQSLLTASGYQSDSSLPPAENYRRALEAVENHLAQSSIPVAEQQLLALTGIGALRGWHVELADDEHDFQVYYSDTEEIDPVVVHRLAKALDRSPDQEPLLWQHITAAASQEPEETRLVLAAVRSLLDEVPMNEMDDMVGKVIIDSILGG